MDREAWHAAIHGITKSRIQLSNWSELKQFSDLPKWIAPGHQHQRPRHRPLSVARSPTLLPAKGSFCPEVPSGLQVTFTCYWTFYQNTCSVSFCFTSFAQCYVLIIISAVVWGDGFFIFIAVYFSLHGYNHNLFLYYTIWGHLSCFLIWLFEKMLLWTFTSKICFL